MSKERKDTVSEAKDIIAFENAVAFLAEMTRKYGHLIVPATNEDVIEYLNRSKKKAVQNKNGAAVYDVQLPRTFVKSIEIGYHEIKMREE